jgi:hypothetical protein
MYDASRCEKSMRGTDSSAILDFGTVDEKDRNDDGEELGERDTARGSILAEVIIVER